MKSSRLFVIFALFLCMLRIIAAQGNVLTGEGSGSVRTAPQHIQLGSATQTPNPEIPKKLRKIDLIAVLSATLSTDGTVKNVKSLGGDPEFASLVVNAVQQWRYAPATLNSQPVEADVFITLQSLKGEFHTLIEPDTLPTEQPAQSATSVGDDDETILRVDGHIITPPKALYAPDPQYSEKARRAKYQGFVVLGVVVGRDGNPKAAWVVKKLGLGLDEQALDAVHQWRFDPARKGGEPVAVKINVEVTFRLLR